MPDSVYLGNPLLKKANTQIEFTKDQILEFVKCKEDPVYFTRNYVKIVNVDDGLVNFNMWPFQENLISNFHRHRFNIVKCSRQVGKALSLDTPIPTPTGWTTMGDIKVGDKILDPTGNEVSVTFKTETMFNHDCYKIYFDNGDEIIADSDHLWEVNCRDWRNGKRVITTNEIYSKYLKKSNNKKSKGVIGPIYIDYTNPIVGSENTLPIDPYLLGIWLGDGYSRDGIIIAHKDDYEYYKNRIDVEHEKQDKNCIRFKCRNLYKKLKEDDLLRNKHIPEIYLRSSIQQRLELLRGLMDTDGSITKTQSFEFYQKNYDLVLQVVELLSSLGIKSRISRKLIDNCYYYKIRFASKERLFNLPRKVKLIDLTGTGRPQNKRIYIHRIEKVESVPVACIQVDSEDHLFLCGRTFIPTHNTTTVVSYLLHYIVFNDSVTIGILGNKASTSREILSRLQLAYENLPKWMQQGIVSWNKGSMELENGSKIIAASTSASAVRGMTFNIIFLDEFAFVPNHIADEFFASVYPTISSGKSTKVIIVSTPRGLNKFYQMWHDAERGRNEFVTTEVHWSQVPGRDEEWKKQTIANTSEQQFKAEHECEFIGSIDTLISPSKLKVLVYDKPIKKNKNLDVFEDPIDKHEYLITVDVARGVEKDYSAFIVIDITQFPHKVVAKYRNNQIKPMIFPSVIVDIAKSYNNAYVFCEVNDVGDQVASIIHYDLEYSNLLMCSMRGRAGQIVGQGFSGKKTQFGVKMSKTVKKVGCLNLKTIIEEDKIYINDYDIISELTTFIQKHNSFEAEDGSNDDLVICLVLYAWIVAQDYFKELTEQDIRKRLYEEQENQLEQDMAPFGFISTGETESSFVDIDGDRWFLDEYGDTAEEISYMWSYL